MDTVGKRVRYARTQAGMTQQQLADRVGVSREAISLLEHDKSRSTKKAMEIAKALDVSPGWLLWGDKQLDRLTPEILQLALDLSEAPVETRAVVQALIAANKKNTSHD
jgi:transcriptional regulator with XRE-family HTH domain